MVKASKSNGVSASESGEGLPYAPVNWPNNGDIWRWRVGKRKSSYGYYTDRFLIAPERLWKQPGKKLEFGSKISIRRYIRKKFPRRDDDEFWDSFTWKVPAKGNFDVKDEFTMETKRTDGIAGECSRKMSFSDSPWDNLDMSQNSEEEAQSSEKEEDKSEEQGHGASGEEERRGEENIPYEIPLEVSVRRIKEFKRRQEELKRKQEGKRKGKSVVEPNVCRQTKSVRKTAMEQPIGTQFHNTDEVKERSFNNKGVTAPTTYYKRGHCVATEALMEAIDKALLSIADEQKQALEENKTLVKKLEAKAARKGK